MNLINHPTAARLFRLSAAMALFLAGLVCGHSATPVFHPVDLSVCGTNRLEHHGEGDCWSVVPRGRQTLGDVPYQLDTLLEVTGMGTLRDQRIFFPTRLAGIPAGHKANRIHVLHGVGYADPDGTPVGKLSLQYSDGSEYSFYLVYGVHTRNWWREPSETKSAVSDPNSGIAWTYAQESWNLRLFKTAFENPYPDRIIESISFYSMFKRSTPFIVAMTLEENADLPRTPPRAAPAVDESAYRRELLLKFVDKTGKPVPGVVCRFNLTDASKTLGFGGGVANERGRLLVDYPAGQVLEFVVEARSAAYMPSRLVLTNAAAGNLPAEQLITLEQGIAMGGSVRQRDGHPLPGATVSLYRVVYDAVGQALETEIGTVQTGADGRWITWGVPPDAKSLTFKVRHPDMRPAEYYLSETGGSGAEELARAELVARAAVMQMDPGIVIAGTALAPDGRAITGANVLLRESAEEPVDHAMKTDTTGRFKFTLLHSGEGTLAIAAPGFAPIATNLSFEDNPPALKLRLQKATPLKGRVLSLEDEPVAEATVTLAAWQELPFPKWETRTDAEGRFTWDSPPLEGATYTVRKAGFGVAVPQPLQPGEKEQVLRLVKNGMITGTVIDAETKQPVPAFRLFRGNVYGGEDISWDRYQPTRGSNGKYTFENDNNHLNSIRLLVEADGYLPQVSPTIRSRGWTTNDFALQKGRGPQGILKLPDGKPAENAEVALLTGDYTQLKNRRLVRSGGSDRGATVVRTGADGKFVLPAAYATQLVAVHPDGYAEARLECLSTNLELTLQPWGKLEGVVRNGKRPATNEWVMLAAESGGFGMRLQYDFESYRTQSDDQGRFVLKDVPPGDRFLVRLYQQGRSWAWSHGQHITIKAGGVTTLPFGGNGRTIIGKVVPGDPKRQISWQTGHHILGTRQPKPPTTFKNAEEVEAWSNSPEVKEARRKYRYYAAQFESDGSFRVEDVPPGVYDLNLHFNEPGDDGGVRMGAYIGSVHQEVEVPEMPNGPLEEPLDLGKLPLVEPARR